MRHLATAALCAALFVLGTSQARPGLTIKPPPITVSVDAPGQRVAIADIDRTPVGADITVIGYYSHKSDETDGDLQVFLIDHKGDFVVAEAPHRFREMRYFIRGQHFHRNDLVIVRGTLTRQFDKPTFNYPAGWMEINPVTSIAHYDGDEPADLHYTQVIHNPFGRTRVVER
ncbi:MAG TPA: hypothetical protein VKF82_12760 [Candidatus Eremiobacteraceae bacterium]|nr:hypothetical protein [Candidatus Eremiobacteraceae bacterium]